MNHRLVHSRSNGKKRLHSNVRESERRTTDVKMTSIHEETNGMLLGEDQNAFLSRGIIIEENAMVGTPSLIKSTRTPLIVRTQLQSQGISTVRAS